MIEEPTPETVAMSYVIENIGTNIRIKQPIKRGNRFYIPLFLPLENGEEIVCGVIELDEKMQILTAPTFKDCRAILSEALSKRFIYQLFTIVSKRRGLFFGMDYLPYILGKRINGQTLEEIYKLTKTYHHKISEISIKHDLVYMEFVCVCI